MTDGVQIDPRIASAASGDRSAADGLLREHLPRIRNLIRYLIRGDRDVDDVAQHALIAVLRGLPSYRGEGRFEAWIDRVTVRETFTYLRRERKQADARSLPFDVDTIAVEHRGTFLERRETVERLDTLPGDQRAAIVLHYLVGMSVPEMAAATGVSQDTAKSRIRLGMAKLRRAAQAEEKIA